MNSAHCIQESRDHRLFVSFPRLFADFHALHRLLTPRHPPCALSSLATTIQNSRFKLSPQGPSPCSTHIARVTVRCQAKYHAAPTRSLPKGSPRSVLERRCNDSSNFHTTANSHPKGHSPAVSATGNLGPRTARRPPCIRQMPSTRKTKLPKIYLDEQPRQAAPRGRRHARQQHTEPVSQLSDKNTARQPHPAILPSTLTSGEATRSQI